MKSTTVRISDGHLADVSVVELGARTGWLWRGGGVVLAGLGSVAELGVARPAGGGETIEHLRALAGPNELHGTPGTGPIALGAFAFDQASVGTMSVPEIVLGNDGTNRWLTTIGRAPDDAIDRVRHVLEADPAGPFGTRLQVRSSRTASDWRDNVVRSARDRILAGELRKAVLARELVVSADAPIDQRSLIVGLARRFPAATCFAIDGFIGASPERLVARSGRVVRAQPLAGTAATNVDPVVDAEQVAALRSSTKDQSEHRITIDWLLSELLPFCSYVDAEPEPSIMTMENVHHLATTVEGMLSEPAASILDLVAAVHPTPALGGDPQHVALDLIEELEGLDRGRYGGPVGWADAEGNGDFAVGIRSTQIDDTVARVWAGVGVVGQSDPAAELRETQSKFQALLGSLLA